jgi:tetrahydrodipicolinate N-succinyltransferase
MKNTTETSLTLIKSIKTRLKKIKDQTNHHLKKILQWSNTTVVKNHNLSNIESWQKNEVSHNFTQEEREYMMSVDIFK